jgi:hypothetical protein
LKLIAAARKHEHEEKVNHPRDRNLGLSDADSLNKDDVEPGRLAEQDRFTRGASHAAKSARGRRRPYESVGIGGQASHARFIAKDCAAGPAGRWIDGKNRDPMPICREKAAKVVDKG